MPELPENKTDTVLDKDEFKNIDKLARSLDQWIKKMKCSGDTGLGIESFQDINVGVDDGEVDEDDESYDTVDEEELLEQFLLSGHSLDSREDASGIEIRLSSQTIISGTFRNLKRNGVCQVTFVNGKVAEIIGNYSNGKLSGEGKVTFPDKSFLIGYFKLGVLHGFVRHFDSKGRLRFLGSHRHGHSVGVCWKIIQGGGCVVGRVDNQGHLTGPDISYLYPDFRSGYVGTFLNGVLVSGVSAHLEDSYFDDRGVLVPIMARDNADVHQRCAGQFPDQDDLQALMPDPYESRLVVTGPSSIPGANDGLHAVIPIESNTIVAFYHGQKVRPEDFDPESWDGNCYKIFDPSDYPRGTIDIPLWAQDASRYKSSSAHKTNHSFQPNSQFIVFDHPKFGIIPGVMTLQDVQQGEEIVVSYGYDLSESPDWYKVEWERSPLSRAGVSFSDWQNCRVKLGPGGQILQTCQE